MKGGKPPIKINNRANACCRHGNDVIAMHVYQVSSQCVPLVSLRSEEVAKCLRIFVNNMWLSWKHGVVMEMI